MSLSRRPGRSLPSHWPTTPAARQRTVARRHTPAALRTAEDARRYCPPKPFPTRESVFQCLFSSSFCILLHTAWSPCCFVKARENVDRGLTVGIDIDLCRYAEEMRSVRLKRNRERDLETYNLAFAAIDEDGSGVRFPIPFFLFLSNSTLVGLRWCS